MRNRYLALVLAVTLVWSSSCVSLSVKQKASNVRQSVHAGLILVDDAERQLCQPVPAAVNTCGAVPRLITDEKHQEFHRVLAKAYDADIRAGNAIIAIQPCPSTPCVIALPPEITELKLLADQALAIASALFPSPKVAALVDKARVLVDLVAQLISAFNAGDIAAAQALYQDVIELRKAA